MNVSYEEFKLKIREIHKVADPSHIGYRVGNNVMLLSEWYYRYHQALVKDDFQQMRDILSKCIDLLNSDLPGTDIPKILSL